ncbi:MAG TPA: FKBP-type peptidyl-prolyl cis-trans isomerase [Solirubrobacteraceae bacterium]|nr:FKBP-type peptidyl-prolyl cis-trans isomerase [Solirubrobacteraceae bacterium]
MTNFNGLISPLRARRAMSLATLATTVVIVGCGGSSNSSTITVGAENAADNALAKQTETSAKKATETATAKTPTSGPLSKEPAVTPPSGPAPTKLEIKDLITGTGTEAKAGQTVTVNYVGVLFKGGKEFDSSWKRKEPFSFALGKGQVIPGWDQGVAGMKVGGRRELVIPAALAYGAKGSGSAIPPNAPLVFVIDLLGT